MTKSVRLLVALNVALLVAVAALLGIALPSDASAVSKRLAFKKIEYLSNEACDDKSNLGSFQLYTNETLGPPEMSVITGLLPEFTQISGKYVMEGLEGTSRDLFLHDIYICQATVVTGYR